MTLTMKRTRTQTVLAKLVEVLANVNGELAFVRELMDEAPAHREALQAREAQLERGTRGPVPHDSAVQPAA